MRGTSAAESQMTTRANHHGTSGLGFVIVPMRGSGLTRRFGHLQYPLCERMTCTRRHEASTFNNLRPCINISLRGDSSDMASAIPRRLWPSTADPRHNSTAMRTGFTVELSIEPLPKLNHPVRATKFDRRSKLQRVTPNRGQGRGVSIRIQLRIEHRGRIHSPQFVRRFGRRR